jgi:hypothetical protein
MTDDEREAVLIDEIQQIVSQYKIEVPGARHAWPKSVKERVEKLFALGIKPKFIAKRTGLSYHTVSLWNSKAHHSIKAFQPVKVVEARSSSLPVPTKLRSAATVTVKKRGRPKRTATPLAPSASIRHATVTVTTPTGFVIENLPSDVVLNWLMGVRR